MESDRVLESLARQGAAVARARVMDAVVEARMKMGMEGDELVKHVTERLIAEGVERAGKGDRVDRQMMAMSSEIGDDESRDIIRRMEELRRDASALRPSEGDAPLAGTCSCSWDTSSRYATVRNSLRLSKGAAGRRLASVHLPDTVWAFCPVARVVFLDARSEVLGGAVVTHRGNGAYVTVRDDYEVPIEAVFARVTTATGAPLDLGVDGYEVVDATTPPGRPPRAAIRVHPGAAALPSPAEGAFAISPGSSEMMMAVATDAGTITCTAPLKRGQWIRMVSRGFYIVTA